MRHIRLGRTGLSVSRLCLGTPRHRRRLPAGRRPRHGRPHGGPGPLARGPAARLRGSDQVCGRDERPAGTAAPRASTSWTRSTARSAACAPTAWISTSSTTSIRRPRSTRPCAPSTTWCGRERPATSGALGSATGTSASSTRWEALRPLAAEAGLSPARLAIAWVLAELVVSAPIVGASRPEQLDDVLPAADKPMDAALKARLDEMTRPYRWGDDPR